MRMQVDTARHHDHAAGVEFMIAGRVGFFRDKAAVANVQVTPLAIYAVDRIVECAALEARQAHGLLPAAATARDRRAAIEPVVGNGLARAAVSGATTDPSIRNRCPPLSTPGV